MKKDLKIGIKIILLMLIGGVAGFLGIKFAGIVDIFGSIHSLGRAWVDHGFLIFLVWSVLYMFLVIVLYLVGRRQLVQSLKREDEIPKDEFLGAGFLLSGLGYFLSIGLFFIMLQGMDNLSLQNLIIAIGILLGMTLLMTLFQHRYVEVVKSYHPEKEGEVTDFDFHKKWINSSDEREQQDIFEAGYHAYQVMQTMILVLLVFSGLYTFGTQSGIIAVVILMVLAVGGNLAYYFSVRKKEKGRRHIDS